MIVDHVTLAIRTRRRRLELVLPWVTIEPPRRRLRCIARIIISLRIVHATLVVIPKASGLAGWRLSMASIEHGRHARCHAREHGLVDWIGKRLDTHVHPRADRIAMRMLDAMADR